MLACLLKWYIKGAAVDNRQISAKYKSGKNMGTKTTWKANMWISKTCYQQHLLSHWIYGLHILLHLILLQFFSEFKSRRRTLFNTCHWQHPSLLESPCRWKDCMNIYMIEALKVLNVWLSRPQGPKGLQSVVVRAPKFNSYSDSLSFSTKQVIFRTLKRQFIQRSRQLLAREVQKGKDQSENGW